MLADRIKDVYLLSALFLIRLVARDQLTGRQELLLKLYVQLLAPVPGPPQAHQHLPDAIIHQEDQVDDSMQTQHNDVEDSKCLAPISVDQKVTEVHHGV